MRDGEEFVLNEAFYSERSQFPILQIANRIPIEMLPPEDIMFLSAPPQYASAISEYINAVFYKKDITATVVGDLIMCMSVYPKEAYEDGFNPNPDHTEGFFTQLTGALADFNLSFRDFKYGDDYYSQYGQHYDPFMVHAIDETARKMATFDGREFNKRTYEKCKYLFMLAMNGEPVPMSFIDNLKREDPALFNHINAFFNSVIEKISCNTNKKLKDATGHKWLQSASFCYIEERITIKFNPKKKDLRKSAEGSKGESAVVAAGAFLRFS